MRLHPRRLIPLALFVAAGGTTSPTAGAGMSAVAHRTAHFTAKTGAYVLSFRASDGAVMISRPDHRAALAIRELAGRKPLNLLYAVRAVHHQGDTWTLTGHSSWASFTLRLSLPAAVPGLIQLNLSVNPRKDPPSGVLSPDIRVLHASSSSLHQYAPAPPIAGNSLFLSTTALGSSIFYFSDYSALGQYFDRTGSGVSEPTFTYPRAGIKGSPLGTAGTSFGYVPPGMLSHLPHHKSTQIIATYLYLIPQIPSGQAAEADTYLRMLDIVYARAPKPSIPSPDWNSIAVHAATDLADSANLVAVGDYQYLRAYVSDTRTSPELITQVSVLAGIRSYEARYHVTVPLGDVLDRNLPTFYDPVFHTVVNGLPHDPEARSESWYFVHNLIGLLQLAKLGDETAHQLLLNSAGAAITLAHVNGYEFPQQFAYRDFKGGQSGVQSDVAGGYAWLMLGLYDLTGQSAYLDEAKTAIGHVAGHGFDLSYETHLTAYAAAAAQRLYVMTGTATYHDDALEALANLFHSTRLWDCTYGACRRGSRYHTYMGLNPLPWSDYIAMLEQYEAWLGLRDYLSYAHGEPAYVTDLAQAFVTYSPLTLQYALPPRLPVGVASPAAGEYSFVPRNNLSWYIPLEDLREGEATSGSIGQEIYGAGGPFMFAAYG